MSNQGQLLECVLEKFLLCCLDNAEWHVWIMKHVCAGCILLYFLGDFHGCFHVCVLVIAGEDTIACQEEILYRGDVCENFWIRGEVAVVVDPGGDVECRREGGHSVWRRRCLLEVGARCDFNFSFLYVWRVCKKGYVKFFARSLRSLALPELTL